MGNGFFALAVAAIARLVWTRTVRQGRPVFAPAWLGVAGLVSLFTTLGIAGQDLREVEEGLAERL